MKQILFELTEELFAALDAGKGDETRNAFIERCLWSSAAVKRAAKQLGIEKPARRKPGRPKAKKN
jgi:hypothetical protein